MARNLLEHPRHTYVAILFGGFVTRISILSLAFICGLLSWTWWQPTLYTVKIGLLLLFCLLYWKPQGALADLLLSLMVYVLGACVCSSLPTPIHTDAKTERSIGWIKAKTGNYALLENPTERIELHGKKGELPPMGALVSVSHKAMHDKGSLSNNSTSTQHLQNHTIARDIVDIEILESPDIPSKPEYFAWAEHGNMLWTLVSGDKSQLEPEEKILFQETGTAHILAISGMHIGLLSMIVYFCVVWLASPLVFFGYGIPLRNAAILLSIATSIVYGEQVGWPASAQRSVIMIALFGLAKIMELDFSIWDVLGFSAMVILYREPSTLYDIGFQLSFVSVMGIACTMEWLRYIEDKLRSMEYWKANSLHPLTKKLLIAMSVSAGAMIATLPICASVFQQIPLVGVLSNLVVAPLIASVSLPLSIIAMISDNPISLFALAVADASVHFSIICLELLHTTPLFLAPSSMEFWLLVLCVTTIAIWPYLEKHEKKHTEDDVLFPTKKRQFPHRYTILFMAMVIGISQIFFASSCHTRTRDQLTIQYLDVGQGDSTLVQFPDGRNWLIDAGQYNPEIVSFLHNQGVWKLDMVIISHMHRDHVDGLRSILRKIPVDTIVVGYLHEPNYENSKHHTENSIVEIATEQNIPIKQASPEIFANIPNTTIHIHHPLDWRTDRGDITNEESLVIELVYGQRHFLFTGDMEEQAEEHLLETISPDMLHGIDVLKVAHHGSSSSSSPPFLERVDPTYAIISCGRNNSYHHPHAKTIWNLRDAIVMRTDKNGTITVKTDGIALAVSPQYRDKY